MPHCRDSAFSMIELLIGLVLTGLLAVLAYRVLSKQVSSSFSSANLARLDKETIQGIEKLRSDLEGIDFNWRANGFLPISFQPGKGPDGSDWITILVPDKSNHHLYRFAADQDGSTLLDPGHAHLPFPVDSQYTPDFVDPAVGDQVLIFSTGQYVVGRVSNISRTLGAMTQIYFSPLTDAEIATNSQPGMVTHFPSTPGKFAFADSVYQKVKQISFQLSDRTDAKGKKTRFLVRREGGQDSVLAPVDQLRFKFDELVGTQAVSTQTPSEWANLLSIQVELSTKTDSGKNRNVGFKVSLTGDAQTKQQLAGKLSALPTGNIANVSVGQPAIEVYEDGSSRMFVPTIQLGSSASTSAGKLAIIDAQTGLPVGSPISLVTSTGEPFLPSVVVSLHGNPSPGLVIGGFTQNGSTPVQVLGFIQRSSSTQKIEPTSPVNFTVLPGGPGRFDTASVAVIGGDIYFSSYSKTFGGVQARILTTQLSGNTFTNPTIAASIPVGSDVTLASLGEGPSAYANFSQGVASQKIKYLASCISNSSQGADDGVVQLTPKNSSNSSLGTPITIATHNSGLCQGVQADLAGNMYLGGSLVTSTMASAKVIDVVQGNSSPDHLNLDKYTLDQVDGVSRLYFRQYEVASNIIPVGAPASAMTFKELAGSYVFSQSPQHATLAMTNMDPSGTDRNAMITSMDLLGKPSTMLASIAPNFSNPNSSRIQLSSMVGNAAPAAATLPPGLFSNTGLSPTPPERCLPSRDTDKFTCFARKFRRHQNDPTPTPTAVPTGTPTPVPTATPPPAVTPTIELPTPTPAPTGLPCKGPSCEHLEEN